MTVDEHVDELASADRIASVAKVGSVLAASSKRCAARVGIRRVRVARREWRSLWTTEKRMHILGARRSAQRAECAGRRI